MTKGEGLRMAGGWITQLKFQKASRKFSDTPHDILQAKAQLSAS
jgi:hypothetical protein